MWKQLALVAIACTATYWFIWDDKLHTLKDKRVLVTGASEGIGEHIAYHYARLGANVVVTARRLEKLNKVVAKCQSLSPSPNSKHFAVSGDMLKLNDTKRVIEEAVKHMGGLDILVLNHIMPTANSMQPFRGTPEQLVEFHQRMDINFMSYIHLASHALPHLTENEGSIIVVNSVAGKVPQLMLHSYCASKFALNGFFNSLRHQFTALDQNVSITSCTLGFIGTDSLIELLNRTKKSLWLASLQPASPSDTALDVIIGGARRDVEVYTPYMIVRPLIFLHRIMPGPVEYVTNKISKALANQGGGT